MGEVKEVTRAKILLASRGSGYSEHRVIGRETSEDMEEHIEAGKAMAVRFRNRQDKNIGTNGLTNDNTGAEPALQTPQPALPTAPAHYPPAYMQSEAHWDRLRTRAREALRNPHDPQLQALLQRHYFALAPAQRPSENEVVSLVADFLHVAHQRLEARHAARLLMLAGWDYEAAQRRYWTEQVDELGLGSGSGSEELSSASMTSAPWSGEVGEPSGDPGPGEEWEPEEEEGETSTESEVGAAFEKEGKGRAGKLS